MTSVESGNRVTTKADNVPWLTDIPAGWQVVRSLSIFNVGTERAREEDEHLSATQAYGVIPLAEYERLEGRQIVKTLMHQERRRHVERDDFVISMRSFQGGLERVWQSGSVRSSYVVLTPSPKVHVGFYAHLFKSQRFIEALRATANFIRDGQDLSLANFKLVDLPLVPLDEQIRIASFLDRKTAAIDALIAKKRRLVELLAEKRAALINQAVTKGLDPTVPMRDSGIPWIGEIPAHWNLRPLGYSVSLRGGSTPSKEEPSFWGGDIPWVSPKDMKVFEIGDSLDHVTNDALRRTSLKTIPVGATLVVVRGMILARTLPVAITTSPVTINQDMKALVPSGHLHPEFLAWQLRSRVAEAMTLIEEAGHGTKTFRTDLFTKLMLLVPSREEQYGIIAHLKRRVTEIEQAESKIHDSLALLQERRQALISAAVTGQLQIPVTEPKESWSRVLAENPKLASKGSP